MGDPQLPNWLIDAFAVLYLAASLCILGWGVIGFYHCYRAFRAFRAWRAARQPPAVTLDEHRLSGRFSYLPADQARIEAEIAEYDEAIKIIGQRRQP